MFLPSSKLKLLARIQLKKNLMLPVSFTSIYIFIYAIFALYYNMVLGRGTTLGAYLIPLGVSFLFSLFFSVFTVGIYRIYLLQAERKESLLSEFIYGVKHSPDRIISVAFFKLIATHLPLLPGGIVLILYYVNGAKQEAFVALGMLLLIIGILIYYVLSLQFSLAFFLIADEQDASAIELLKRSTALMKGQKTRLFLLQLSFLPAFFLGVLTYYLAFFLVIPYYFATLTYFYLELNHRIRPEMFQMHVQNEP